MKTLPPARHWLAATSVFAFFWAAPAHADDAASADSDPGQGLGEIVVTAQKRPENLQKTPIAISVISAQGLKDRQVVSLVDIGVGSVPSLTVTPFYSRNSTLNLNIRGVGTLFDVNQPARDQGVGLYIDGVYYGRAQGLGTALFDVKNIEILKGPQGTLFGRNTEGGAINITTKRPSGEFHVEATAGIGNYDSYKSELHLDLPRVHNISVKVDGVIASRGPMVSNPLDGADGFNSYDRRGLHIRALWEPSSNFSADYSYDISRDVSSPLYQQLLANGTNRQAALGTIQTDRARAANVGVPQQPSVGDVSGHRLTLTWDVMPSLKLKSISAYRELTQSQWDNGSASITMSNASGVFTGVRFGRYSTAYTAQDQVSQEIQAIGEVARLKYVAGALYYEENASDNAQAFATNQFTDAAGSSFNVLTLDYSQQRIDRASKVRTRSVGVFGQATYTPPVLDDAVHITGGLRWTRDSKKGSLFTVNGATPVVFGVTGPLQLDESWSRVDPMVTVAFDAASNIHLYGKWSTGYKSGGANSRSLQYLAFGPESVSMFEIGAKTEFFDRRARLNIAAYSGAYKDIQVDVFGLYETVINGVLTRSNRTTTETFNAPGTGRVRGVEAEITLSPFAGLTLGGSYAYNYVRIPSVVNPFPNASGTINPNPVPIYSTLTPTHSGSVTVDYVHPIGQANLRVHLDGNFDSGFYSFQTDPVYISPGNPANVRQPIGEGGSVFNGTIGITDIGLGDSGARLGVSLWARNLFNEQHFFYKSLSVASGLGGFPNDFRTFGAQVKVAF